MLYLIYLSKQMRVLQVLLFESFQHENCTALKYIYYTILQNNWSSWLVNFMLDKSRNKLTLFSFRHHGMMTWSQLTRITAFPVKFDGSLLPRVQGRSEKQFGFTEGGAKPWTVTLVVLHRTLGRRLPSNFAGKAVIWVSCDQVIIRVMTKTKQCKFISGFV